MGAHEPHIPAAAAWIVVAGIAAAGALATGNAAAEPAPNHRRSAVCMQRPAGRCFFAAETTSGKVLGIDNAGVKEFKGILPTAY